MEGNQSRREMQGNQPVPDQRFYTKTNFFTINNNEADTVSVAEKYHNLQSQKSSRRPNPYSEASQLRGGPNYEEFSPQSQHQRMQSFTEGVGP